MGSRTRQGDQLLTVFPTFCKPVREDLSGLPRSKSPPVTLMGSTLTEVEGGCLSGTVPGVPPHPLPMRYILCGRPLDSGCTVRRPRTHSGTRGPQTVRTRSRVHPRFPGRSGGQGVVPEGPHLRRCQIGAGLYDASPNPGPDLARPFFGPTSLVGPARVHRSQSPLDSDSFFCETSSRK